MELICLPDLARVFLWSNALRAKGLAHLITKADRNNLACGAFRHGFRPLKFAALLFLLGTPPAYPFSLLGETLVPASIPARFLELVLSSGQSRGESAIPINSP
jgi:hypothetical protein